MLPRLLKFGAAPNTLCCLVNIDGNGHGLPLLLLLLLLLLLPASAAVSIVNRKPTKFAQGSTVHAIGLH